MQIFGERLKKLRIKRHMTQDELGLIFDPPLAQSTVGTYERGIRQPTFENLIVISEYFNVSIDYLLGVTDEERTIKEYKEENPQELKEFLRQNNILFNGAELSKDDKQRMLDILTGLFWESFTNKK